MKYLPETTAELQQLVRDENIKLSDSILAQLLI